MAKKPVQAGLPTRIVAENLRRLRAARGLSVRALSELTSGADGNGGVPPNGISEIENGLRKVDVDDLIALSLGLDVSPAVLLMPVPDLPDDDGEGIVYLDPDDPLVASHVWDWLTAAGTLTTGERTRRAEEDGDFDPYLDAQERELWRQRTLPKFARKKDTDDG